MAARRTGRAAAKAPAPVSLENLALGRKIRELRQGRRLSLTQLGERCQLSVALLSQIERGAGSPSMRSLRQVADGLGVNVETLFVDPAQPSPDTSPNIVRHDRRRVLNLAQTGISIELLTTSGFKRVQTFFSYIVPGGGSGAEDDSHVGSESGVVLTGQMELWLDGTRHLLNPGDSFCFDSRTPHRYRNPGTAMLQAYWVISPPIY